MFLRSTLLLMTCPAPLSHGHPSPSPPHWNATWVPAQITILLHRKPVFGASTLSLAPRGHGILPVPRLQMEAPSPPLSTPAPVLSRRPQKPTPGQEEDLLEGHPVVYKLDGKRMERRSGLGRWAGSRHAGQPGSPGESTAKRVLKAPAAGSCLCSPRPAELLRERQGGRGLT